MRVYKRKYPNGKTSKDYYYCFYFKGKKIRQRGTSNKEKTKELGEIHRVQLKMSKIGIEPEKKRERVNFDDLAERFLEYSKSNKRSWERDVVSMKALRRVFSGKYIDEIRPGMIERYRDQRKRKISGSSVNRELACLKTMYNKAIFWELTSENPVRGVEFLKENPLRTRYLNHDEIERLQDACPDYLRRIVVFALNTGMRKSEILGLTWDRVNLDQGIIELVETKNGEIRQVPITPDAREVLGLKRDIGPVFMYEGKSVKDVKRSFATACRKAEIRNFRFHDLRHTWASYFMMNGGTLYDLMIMGGWKDISMVRRYTHLDRKYRMRIMNVASPTAGTKQTRREIIELREAVTA